VIVKVADVAPAGTVTEAGTCASADELASDTTNPPAGAGPVRVTVPVEEVPPVTVVGLSDSELRTGAVIVSTAFWLVEPDLEAVIVAVTVDG